MEETPALFWQPVRSGIVWPSGIARENLLIEKVVPSYPSGIARIRYNGVRYSKVRLYNQTNTWVEGLVSEHDAGTYTMVYHCKGTCICSLTNRCTRVYTICNQTIFTNQTNRTEVAK